MPKLTRRIPSYRRHKASGQALVTLEGRDFYLGPHGTKVSRAEYDRVVGEWQANGRQLHRTREDGDDLTISKLALRYWRHAEGYYVKNGRPTGELPHIKAVIRLVRERYGRTLVRDFSPVGLKAVRESMVEHGLARRVVNGRINRVRRMFKWGVENDLVPTATLTVLQAVAPLKRGRSRARETDPVRPAPNDHIDAVRSLVASQVWAMVELQRLTGMRPGEAVVMRTCDIANTDAKVWTYVPESHKTEHHGHRRVAYIGPRGQAILRDWLRPDLDGYLFQPREAMADRRKQAHADRKTPMSCGNRPGTNRKRRPKKQPGQRYTVDSYRRAITAACKKAKVPEWSPGQLRHNAATVIRREHGLEMARIILGHQSAVTSEIYAEVDQAKAMSVISKIG